MIIIYPQSEDSMLKIYDETQKFLRLVYEDERIYLAMVDRNGDVIKGHYLCEITKYGLKLLDDLPPSSGFLTSSGHINVY